MLNTQEERSRIELAESVTVPRDEWIEVLDEVDSLRADLEVEKEAKLAILRGEFGQICSYCGEGNEDGLSWEELQLHIRQCAKHPLAQALSDLEAERERAKEFEMALERISKHENLVLFSNRDGVPTISEFARQTLSRAAKEDKASQAEFKI